MSGVEWKHWAGGPCPVGSSVVVEVILRGGGRARRAALALRWEHQGAADDIMLYMLVDQRPTECADLVEPKSQYESRLLHEYARAAISGVLAGPEQVIDPKRVADTAADIAEAMVAEARRRGWS